MFSEKNLNLKIKTIANQCVACGLCLPHCPTYRQTESEADSPRGRIALMKGVVEQRIPLNARFVEHIDLCLTCQACERVCPSQVKYGELIDGMRTLIQEKMPPTYQSSLKTKTLHTLIKKPALFKAFTQLLVGYQKLGLAQLFRWTKLLDLLHLTAYEAFLPPLRFVPKWQSCYAVPEPKGHVALFLGCVTRHFDVTTLQDSIYVLNQLGYSVHIPTEQGCCGAFFQHQGHATEAVACQQLNHAAFSPKLAQPQMEALLFTATGCGTTLIQQNWDYPVRDITAFLCEKITANPIKWQAPSPPLHLFVHEPCSLKNVLKQEKQVYQLLQTIPNITCEPLAENAQCCGFGGNYAFTQPEMSDKLRHHKEKILAQCPEIPILVTTNIGCALQLQRALKATQHLETQVLHPVSVLARYLATQHPSLSYEDVSEK